MKEINASNTSGSNARNHSVLGMNIPYIGIYGTNIPQNIPYINRVTLFYTYT